MNTILKAYSLSNETLKILDNIQAQDIRELRFRLVNGMIVMMEIKDVPPPVNRFQRIQECINAPHQEITLKRNGGEKHLYMERITKVKI